MPKKWQHYLYESVLETISSEEVNNYADIVIISKIYTAYKAESGLTRPSKNENEIQNMVQANKIVSTKNLSFKVVLFTCISFPISS